jgi:hypothetical protein
MKNVFVLLLMLTLMSSLQAQEIGFTLKSGQVMRDKVSQRTVDIADIGRINGQTYFLYLPWNAVYNQASIGATENYFVGKFDKDLNLIKKAEIVIKHDKKDLECDGVRMLKDKLLVFSSFQNSKDKKDYLFAQNLDSKTLELVPNSKLIAELDYSGLSKFNNALFQFGISPDSSKVLIFFTLVSKHGEALRNGMYVYDQDMNLKWKNEDVVAKYSGGVFAYDRFRIDNDGTVFLMGMVYKDRKNYFDDAHFNDRNFFSKDTYFTDKPNYTYQLYRYSDAGRTEDIYTLSLPGKFIRTLNYLPDAGNTIICTGMYASEGKISVEGSFAFNFDLASKQVNNLSTKEFGTELTSLGFDKNELNRFKRSISNKQEWDPFAYILSEMKTKKNGDKYFIAEQYIGGTKTERSGNTITYSTIYMHNDLYAVTLGSDYQIKRIDKISKRQYWLTTDCYNSYADIEKNGNLYFIYNTFESSDGMFKNIELGDSYVTRLDEQGKQLKSIFRKKEDKKLPMPLLKTGISLPDNSIIYSLMSYNWKDYQVQKITITE